MAKTTTVQNGFQGVLGVLMVVGVVSMALLGLGGCAGEQPKPTSPAVTPDHVRGHAGKAFENLKQEERERAANPAGPSY